MIYLILLLLAINAYNAYITYSNNKMRKEAAKSFVEYRSEISNSVDRYTKPLDTVTPSSN